MVEVDHAGKLRQPKTFSSQKMGKSNEKKCFFGGRVVHFLGSD